MFQWIRSRGLTPKNRSDAGRRAARCRLATRASGLGAWRCGIKSPCWTCSRGSVPTTGVLTAANCTASTLLLNRFRLLAHPPACADTEPACPPSRGQLSAPHCPWPPRNLTSMRCWCYVRLARIGSDGTGVSTTHCSPQTSTPPPLRGLGDLPPRRDHPAPDRRRSVRSGVRDIPHFSHTATYTIKQLMARDIRADFLLYEVDSPA